MEERYDWSQCVTADLEILGKEQKELIATS